MNARSNTVSAIEWKADSLWLLDQRILPAEERYIEYRDARSVAQAITDMVVRGAPAIGITAAYGIVLSAMQHSALEGEGFRAALSKDMEILAASRPTAVNLFWAIKKMQACLDSCDGIPVDVLLEEAKRIHQQDIEANQRMGDLGAELITESCAIITHCNAGALATGGYGTALGVVRSAHAAGKLTRVYADETRPWMQGSRLTAWEMVEEGIPVSLVCEGAAASLLRTGRVSWVIVGSDRIAANGDVANKIGTYSLAVNARHHGVKFMVVAPTSTIDMEAWSGIEIPIEERNPDEVLSISGHRIAAEGAEAWNPAFDVTPANLVDAIVTEKGVVLQPDEDKMRALMSDA
jgi:methylthioribose-1-phosphate isomerase